MTRTRALLSLAAVLLSATAAEAQSPKVLEKLHRKYDYVGPFCEGLAVVARDASQFRNPQQAAGSFGFVDTLGRELVKSAYDYAGDFSGPAAIVGQGAPGARKFGLIGCDGTLLCPCVWDRVRPMKEGFSVVWNGDGQRTYALIDSLGRQIDLDYDFCTDFSEGFARVGRGRWKEGTNPAGIPVMLFEGKYGFIDREAREAIPLQYDDAGSFSEHLVRVGTMGTYYVKWGFIDREGKTVVPFRYHSAAGFCNGRAVVSRIVEGKELFGYVDPFGNEAIPCRYTMATPFESIHAWVGIPGAGEPAYSLIDAAGRDVLTYKAYRLNESGKFGHASCAVLDEGKFYYGVVDIRGRVILPFEYDEITIFTDRDPHTGIEYERGIATKAGVDHPFTLKKK